jgi:hypothetical protein
MNQKEDESNGSEFGSKMIDQINLNLNQKEDRTNQTEFEEKEDPSNEFEF